MDQQQLTEYWWYRLLKVVYIASAAVFVIAGISFTGLYISNAIGDYSYNLEKNKEYESLKEEVRGQLTSYGEMLPAIDGLEHLSDYDKGLESAKLTVKRTDNSYYINSLNHNGYHILEDDEVEHYLSIRENVEELASLSAYEEIPGEPIGQILSAIVLFILYIVVGLAIFWLIRRLFFYIVYGDKFMRL